MRSVDTHFSFHSTVTQWLKCIPGGSQQLTKGWPAPSQCLTAFPWVTTKCHKHKDLLWLFCSPSSWCVRFKGVHPALQPHWAQPRCCEDAPAPLLRCCQLSMGVLSACACLLTNLPASCSTPGAEAQNVYYGSSSRDVRFFTESWRSPWNWQLTVSGASKALTAKPALVFLVHCSKTCK